MIKRKYCVQTYFETISSRIRHGDTMCVISLNDLDVDFSFSLAARRLSLFLMVTRSANLVQFVCLSIFPTLSFIRCSLLRIRFFKILINFFRFLVPIFVPSLLVIFVLSFSCCNLQFKTFEIVFTSQMYSFYCVCVCLVNSRDRWYRQYFDQITGPIFKCTNQNASLAKMHTATIYRW